MASFVINRTEDGLLVLARVKKDSFYQVPACDCTKWIRRVSYVHARLLFRWQQRAGLTVYLHMKKIQVCRVGKATIHSVIPGGGYSFAGEREVDHCH